MEKCKVAGEIVNEVYSCRRHGEVVQAGRTEKNNAVTRNSTRRLGLFVVVVVVVF